MHTPTARSWYAGTDAGSEPEQIAPPPPEDKKRLEKAKEDLRDSITRPASGRATPVGRRVEKPGTGRQGGPSGQTDGCKHETRHTNK